MIPRLRVIRVIQGIIVTVGYPSVRDASEGGALCMLTLGGCWQRLPKECCADYGRYDPASSNQSPGQHLAG